MNLQRRIEAEAPKRPSEPLAPRLRGLVSHLEDAAAEADETGTIAPDVWQAIRRSGLLLAPFPERDGGEGLITPERHSELAAVLRALGAADLSVARLLEGHFNAVALVCRYGAPAQIADLAAAVADGALSGVWGAEDAAGLRAEFDGRRWRLTGRKILASGAGFVTRPVVTARAEAGQILLLPILQLEERADVSGWTAQGMRSSATGSVDFTGLTLDAGQALGEPGDFMRQPHFSGGAWRFCAVHLGASERLVDLFREHLLLRGRENDPYQLERIAHCVAATTSAAFWILEAARLLAEPAAAPDIVAFVNLTRMVTERAALDVLETVHRGAGLNAFLRPNPIERISRDLSTYLRQPVPDLAMADAARAVLASPRPTAALWSFAHEG